MTVDIDKLRDLLVILEEKDVAEFEHETEEVRIRIVRAHPPQAGGMGYAVHHGAGAPPHAGAAQVGQASAAAVEEPPSDVVDVTSPFVGTFYRSPSPDAPSF